MIDTNSIHFTILFSKVSKMFHENFFGDGALKNSELAEQLKQCEIYAARGYKLSVEKYNNISTILDDEMNRLRNADSQQNYLTRLQNSTEIESQQAEIESIFEDLQAIKTELRSLHEQQQYFTITVYGRTMAGKSTLMETLIHGDGKSIGNGSQRTTRDVREYFWQGLRIFDVPGIGSFDGREDDNLALNAAKSADLIIFLLSDDAPQSDEAEALAELRLLGKPIIGVLNVKIAMDQDAPRELICEIIKDELETNHDRVQSLINQFKDFAKNHGQDWNNIPFVSAHILSAFIGQRDNDSELYQLSNFPAVEQYIIDKVRSDGRYYRIKTFSDAVSRPMQKIIATIYKHSLVNLEKSLTYSRNLKHLYEWRDKFEKRVNIRLDRFVNSLKSQLDRAISDFTDQHYDDDEEKIEQEWNTIIKSLNFADQCKEILQSISKECEQKLHELSDQLSQEMNLKFSTNIRLGDFEQRGTTPWGQIAFQVLTTGLMFIPGIGWAARIGIGVGGFLFSQLFESKEEKIKLAKQKLRKTLTDASYPMLEELRKKIFETAHENILQEGIDNFSNENLKKMAVIHSNLGKDQYHLAWNLGYELQSSSVELLSEAFRYENMRDFTETIKDIARITGEAMVIVSTSPIPNLSKISNLIDENIRVIRYTEDNDEIINNISNILGCRVHVEDVIDAENSSDDAFIYVAELTVENENRFRLAQQIAGYPIKADIVQSKRVKEKPLYKKSASSDPPKNPLRKKF